MELLTTIPYTYGLFGKGLVWVWEQCQGTEIDNEPSPSSEPDDSNIATRND